VIGIGEDEMFVASDVAAFIAHTRHAVELGQDQLVVINPAGYQVTSFTGGEPDFREFHVDWDLSAAEKGGFEFFMDKEIEEQPAAVAQTLLGHFDGSGIVLDELRLSEDDLRTIDKVFVVACGTAYHSGLVAKYAIEHWCRIPVEVEVASEFRYRDPVLNRDTLVVAVSQSGETVVYIHAGPEIGVASTKAFLGMLTANYLVGLALAQARGTKYRDEIAREYEELTRIPDAIATTLTLMDPVRKLAQEIATSKAILFLGRHVGYPVALEGALKLKELAYMHAEGFAAGELKHGPIALIEEGLPVVIVTPSPVTDPLLHSKLLSNIREIQARGARTIVIAEEGDETVAPFADFLIELPKVPKLYQPLVTTVPLQILAAEIARAKGYDLDKPRNLAKSVTVE
jgi:glucosamine--fructose-6-phosphate aminotransferase (isomerizing)